MINSTSILTVSQLNRQIKTWLEQDVGAVYVEGEVSSLSRPSSGHYYFTLKDASAQVRCVFFRNRHLRNTEDLIQTGQQLLIAGMLSLYEARGDYQLIVETIEAAGQGDLYRQFEQLKLKLAALGLFDAERKKPLPYFPKIIGIITSATAAALQDILTTLARRYPVAHIRIYCSEVQGIHAHHQLITAISTANQEGCCDVLILARGGGSMEDLWAFNHELLAHAIASSAIPIVSGVGHETDFTIADFVADLRAATPTAAAESVTPHQNEIMAKLLSLQSQMLQALKKLILQYQFRLQHRLQQLCSPAATLRANWQSLDFLKIQLINAYKQLLSRQNEEIKQLHDQVISLSQQKLQSRQTTLRTLLATLHAVSPLATLDRGYAIAMRNNHVLLNATQTKPGDLIEVRLAQGQLSCEVLSCVE